jgi:exodeoxyribonuclease VII large subunit
LRNYRVSDVTQRAEIDPPVLSVSQLNRRVAELLEEALPLQTVRGEISNFVRAASGHWYFSLKDSSAQLRAVMFKGRAQQVSFMPRDGTQVEVRGQVTLYQARGDFQLMVDSMRQAGAGNLYQQFLLLKEKLQAEGLFDAARKKPLPISPTAIGVITSASGAALHDVLSTLAKRAPAIPVFIFPSLVQGTEAPTRLIAAITAAQNHAHCSVLLLVRGGGSIEDLWAFNDERLARVIAACPIPIISGVGHESDFTIADFIADQRAPTPTAAAVLAVADQREQWARLLQATRAFAQAWYRQFQSREQRLDYAARMLRPPSAQWRERWLQLSVLANRLHAATKLDLTRAVHRFDSARQHLRAPDTDAAQVSLELMFKRIQGAARANTDGAELHLQQLQGRLRQASPQSTLSRGYSIVRDAGGGVVRSTAQVQQGALLEVLLHDGSLVTRIEQVVG